MYRIYTTPSAGNEAKKLTKREGEAALLSAQLAERAAETDFLALSPIVRFESD